jgi:plastocyanin
MRKFLVLATVAVCSAALAVPALAATKPVKIGDTFFVSKGAKPTITVKAGTTVKWTYVKSGTMAHNVTVTSGPKKFHSKTLKPGASFSQKVTKPGTYKIVCTFHKVLGQTMTLKVTK